MTGPAPWSTDTPALLAAGPLTHTATATITTQDGDTIAVPLIGGTLTYDETRSPRVELTLTTHLSPDSALDARIDPRKATRIRLSVGYVRPDGVTDSQQVANLGLRSKSRVRPDDERTLVARSDEAVLIDFAPAASLTVNTATTTAGITKLIQDALPAAVVTVTATPGPAINTTENDQDRWSAVADYADRIAAVVYDDGTRAWFITPRPNTLTAPVYTIADGAGGTMLDVTEDTDRDAGYGNAVLLVYEWLNTAGAAQRVVAYKTATGTYAPVAGNTLVLRFGRDVPTTQAQADAAATSLAARLVTRGRSYTLTTPSAYWVRPGDTIAITEAGRATESHLVTAISFDLRTGLMTLNTRVPD